MKHKAREIVLFDGADKVFYRGRPEEIPLPMSLIVRLSTQFFNDPDPCFIHQGAVRARVALELEQALVGQGATALAEEVLSVLGAKRAEWAGEAKA